MFIFVLVIVMVELVLNKLLFLDEDSEVRLKVFVGVRFIVFILLFFYGIMLLFFDCIDVFSE